MHGFTTDDFLAALSARRQEALDLEADAIKGGDMRGARSWASHAKKMERLILAKGGTVNTTSGASQ